MSSQMSVKKYCRFGSAKRDDITKSDLHLNEGSQPHSVETEGGLQFPEQQYIRRFMH